MCVCPWCFYELHSAVHVFRGSHSGVKPRISNMQQEVELNLKVQVDLRLQEQVRKHMFEVFVQLIINYSSCESLTDRGSESQRRVHQCQIWRHTSWHRLWNSQLLKRNIHQRIQWKWPAHFLLRNLVWLRGGNKPKCVRSRTHTDKSICWVSVEFDFTDFHSFSQQFPV